MIILITANVFNEKSNRYETLVSHGVDYETDRNIVLPNEPVSSFEGSYFLRKMGENVLFANQAEAQRYKEIFD